MKLAAEWVWGYNHVPGGRLYWAIMELSLGKILEVAAKNWMKKVSYVTNSLACFCLPCKKLTKSPLEYGIGTRRTAKAVYYTGVELKSSFEEARSL